MTPVLNPNLLIDTPEECVVRLPAGKPDPTLACESLQNDLRRRVQTIGSRQLCMLAVSLEACRTKDRKTSIPRTLSKKRDRANHFGF